MTNLGLTIAFERFSFLILFNQNLKNQHMRFYLNFEKLMLKCIKFIWEYYQSDQYPSVKCPYFSGIFLKEETLRMFFRKD